jgi:creatinine amidohydrolase
LLSEADRLKKPMIMTSGQSVEKEPAMHRVLSLMAVTVLAASTALAQAPPAKSTARSAPARKTLVEFEMMTWSEVKAALEAGKTTALFYTGGTEQRGPQNVNGGHTLMGREIVRTIALKLGNAIAMPVLPYTPNNASAQLPGTIGLTPELLGSILERVTEQAMATGFKNVVLMGDHGGGQPQTYADVAKKMDAKYAPEGKHVYFCDEVYAKAQGDFDNWLVEHGYPRSSHAGIPDTSTMLYLGGDKGWVRKELIPTAEGDPVPPRGERGQGRRGQAPDPNAPPRKNNGISGDARRSTVALGKMAFDIKIDYAVKQIQGFLANQPKTTAQ